MDESTWAGVQRLLDDYAAVRADDTVVVLYTSDSYEAAAWVSAALELRGATARRVWMAPLHDDGFGARLAAVLPEPGAVEGRLVVLGFERDTMSHTSIVEELLGSYDPGRCTVLRAISTGPSLFERALQITPADLRALNATVLDRLMPAERLRIETPSGSQLDVQLDRRHRWISNHGTARPGSTVILPAGEVATYPAAIRGRFVADFAFNVNAVVDRDVRLADHPVTLEVSESRVTSFECADGELTRFLESCFTSECAFNVGELGFGTNPAIGDAIAMNSHVNERRRGVHLGLGQHNQEPRVVGYWCQVHLDLIAAGGKVWVDDRAEPLDLEAVAPAAGPHPVTTRDEDVFSPEYGAVGADDCCGILTDTCRPAL